VTCHCGSEKTFEECCKPLLAGVRKAKTAEELMRSRYSAFVEGDIDYVMKTHDPDTVHQIDRDGTKQWADESTWLGLRITDTERGQEGDAFGRVDFVASYELRGAKVDHRESATFRRLGDSWVFVDGEQIAGPPVRREEPKLGRNEPCSCGSGKKYKKCCGAAA
jgi:SEC-C motif-containing protein